MSDPAFLVDGHLEKKFIQQICPGKTVRILNCNGKDVHMSAIAERIATQCRLLKGKYYPIIIVIDRECRDESFLEIKNSLTQEVKNLQVNDQLIIAVADRMIENWIVADIATVSKYSSKVVSHKEYDGKHGKNILTKILKNYHETTDGVSLLVSCYASRIRANSPSFGSFYDELAENKIEECWWLSR